MCFSWLTENRRSVFWSDVYETLICLPMSLTVLKTLLAPYNKPFKVTPKGNRNPDRIQVNWRIAGPLLVLMGLSVLGLLRPVLGWTTVAVNPDSYIVNLLWATYNLMLLTVCVLAAIDVPQAPYPWFNRREACQLAVAGHVWTGETLALSEGGAVLVLPDAPSQVLARGRLTFVQPSPLAGLSLPVQVDAQGSQVQVTFLEMPLAALRRLIPHLYCQPYQWREVKVPEFKTLWAMVTSVLRLHPLAEV